MDGPCCLGVVRDGKGLTGEPRTVGGAPAYFSNPAAASADSKGGIGVIVIHDIWGFNIPNAKYIADFFASNGFPSLLPNLYHGISTLDGWPGTEFDDGEALEGGKWDGWWSEITGLGYWAQFHERMAAAIAFLKEQQGCTTLCLIGFCWGGIAIEQLSTTGVFAQAASVHGCHESSKNYLAAKAKGCNIEYHTVPGDDSFPKEAQAKLREAGASVSIYEGMEHGFAVRGDFAGNPALKAAADKCLARVVEQFSQATNASTQSAL